MSNLAAFLNAIAVSEGTAMLGDHGYNCIVGSTARQVITFGSYIDHPRLQVWLQNLGVSSTAAGRYQILARYFDAYKKQLNLRDFGPSSQDAIAIQMLKECGAFDDIQAGQFASAVNKASSRWASLPGSEYGQHTNDLAVVRAAYTAAGGTVA